MNLYYNNDINNLYIPTDVQLTIIGFNGSTEMASLVAAFKTLSIDVTLPGLSTNLLESAALTGTCNSSF